MYQVGHGYMNFNRRRYATRRDNVTEPDAATGVRLRSRAHCQHELVSGSHIVSRLLSKWNKVGTSQVFAFNFSEIACITGYVTARWCYDGSFIRLRLVFTGLGERFSKYCAYLPV